MKIFLINKDIFNKKKTDNSSVRAAQRKKKTNKLL